MRKVSPFILCGGSGTRLWPLSREALPKQFHKIAWQETLFQQTCRRLTGDLFAAPIILSNQHHRFLVAEQLEEADIKPAGIVLEPVGRNTAPAACVAALLASRSDPDALVLIVPSDHMIPDAAAFARAIAVGASAAEEGAFVIFGIEPDCPHTGYGYIETEKSNSQVLRVRRFVEKPSREAAEEFIDAGNFFWNAGIFLFKAATLIDLLEGLAPEVLKACRDALEEATDDLGFLRLNGSYAKAPAISLDYAVAEKAGNMQCVPLNTPWSDMGSWSSLWGLLEKDSTGNVALGEGEIVLEQTSNSLAYSDHACVALVGVSDTIVVATEDAVLVVSKEYAESVKTIVEHLKGNGRSHTLHHSRVYRPWGWYQSINKGSRYQVKCIMVKPGAKLSLQSHFHRSEHWVIVTGTLEVTKGDEVELLSENQSTFIPIGKKHRLANPGKIPAFIIEVQSGPYLDEDDIVRFEDVYHRHSNE
ncbi:mannose-1-phosphate guanylyltransferase/mannose-6-phosphate isomerase [Methyloceanibacter sp.]|uniref:mannose-1-phosphate guanylyltransferase/mannose-6-phosphate isomerase n=1 Tax=Methyloceanibacter sp. TaxID=1965321 RepID=UPI003D6D14C4